MVIEKELSCEREIVNAYDTRAYAVRIIIDGDIKTAGHVPCKYLHYVWFLIDEVVQSCVKQRELPTLLGFATAKTVYSRYEE